MLINATNLDLKNLLNRLISLCDKDKLVKRITSTDYIYATNLVSYFGKHGKHDGMDEKELSCLITGTLALLATSAHTYTISLKDDEFVIKEEDSFDDIDEARDDLYKIVNLSNINTITPFTRIRDFVIKNSDASDDEFVLNKIKVSKNRNEKCQIE